MMIHRPRTLPSCRALLCTFVVAASQWLATSAMAQFQVNGNFTGAAVDAGWALSGSAAMTGGVLDPVGSGFLRLTGNNPSSMGRVAFTGGYFTAQNGLTISFNYAAWGGGRPGGDGMAVFLYDASQSLAGALPGGGLGYCKGTGGYLALALDAYGNFSNGAVCGGGGPATGPGIAPQTMSIRGPAAAGNPFIANVAVLGGIDAPDARSRPQVRRVVLTLTPRDAGGFGLTLETGPAGGQLVRVMENVDFPYPAPAALSLAVVAATGGAKNIHEIQGLTLRGNAAALPAVALQFSPASIPAGGTSTLSMNFSTSDGKAATLTAPYSLALPPGMTVAAPLALGGTCPASVTAPTGRDTIGLAAGSGIRANGCSVTVNVQAIRPGNAPVNVGVGALRTNVGANVAPASASLVVGGAAR